jgi:hypothetical protein
LLSTRSVPLQKQTPLQWSKWHLLISRSVSWRRQARPCESSMILHLNEYKGAERNAEVLAQGTEVRLNSLPKLLEEQTHV